MPHEIPVPHSIVEYSLDDGTRIVCRWNRCTTVLGILLALWCGMLAFVVFCNIGLPGKNGMLFDFFLRIWSLPWQILLFSVFLTTVIAYGLIAKFVNITEVRITATKVKIGIQPLPWIGNWTVSVSRSEIIRLFIQEKSKTDSYGEIIKTHDLHFVDPQGIRRPLVRFLRAHEALYLRARLGEILGIDDLSVGGACSV